MSNGKSVSFSALVQQFFTDHLVKQRALSPRTVASYRDAMTLLLRFAAQHLAKAPTSLAISDFDNQLIASFLEHLEQERGNSVRSRNARLAAVRTFLKFAARADIANLHVVERALAVPMKRFDRPMLGFLSREQMNAVIAAPGPHWFGQRDRLILTLLYNTGARVSELVNVRLRDVVLDEVPSVHLLGKGRKHRSVPLWKSTAADVRRWLRSNPQLKPDSPLLPTRENTAMTRANVAQRLQLALQQAALTCPELPRLTISPHTIRHTTAMHLLQAGVDITVIALWLGHEHPSTSHMYVEADLAMKERALSRLAEPGPNPLRYRPPDPLMRFLSAL